MFTVCRMDALVLGSAIAVAMRNPAWGARLEDWTPRLAVFGVVLMIAVAGFTGLYDIKDPMTILVGYPVLSAGFAGLMLVAVSCRTEVFTRWCQKLMSLSPLVSLGKYSYGIYVFHMPIKLVLGPRLETLVRPIGGVGYVVYLLVLVLASYVVAVFFRTWRSRSLFSG